MGFINTVLGALLPEWSRFKETNEKVHCFEIETGEVVVVENFPSVSSRTSEVGVICLHGLGGDSNSNYLKRWARLSVARG